MSNILKESEASKASEASTANNSSQASYASIASPQISYYLKSASGAAKSAPRRPGDLFGDPLKFGGAPEINAIILSRHSARNQLISSMSLLGARARSSGDP